MRVAAIDYEPIWESALVAIVAGVGITAAFAVGVLLVIRQAEMRREQRPLLAGFYGFGAVISLGGAAAAVIIGLIAVA